MPCSSARSHNCRPLDLLRLGKGNVAHVLPVMAYGWSRSIAPLVLNLGARRCDVCYGMALHERLTFHRSYVTLHKVCYKRESFPADVVGALRCVRPVNLYRRFGRSVMSPSAGERSTFGMLRLQDENITFLRNFRHLFQHRCKDIISRNVRVL